MSKVEQYLLTKAISLYKRIHPCGSADSFDECFTVYDGKCVFWFNTEDNTTHALVHDFSRKTHPVERR